MFLIRFEVDNYEQLYFNHKERNGSADINVLHERGADSIIVISRIFGPSGHDNVYMGLLSDT